MNNKPAASIGTAGWVMIGMAIAIALICYEADQLDVPVIAPYIDELTEWIYSSFPLLAKINATNPAATTCALLGGAFLLTMAITYRTVAPSTAHDRLERRLRRQSDRDRQKRLGKDDFIAN